MESVILTAYTREDLKEIFREIIGEFMQPAKGGKPEKVDEWLTVEQAADYLSVTPATIYRRTSENSIPYTKQGKRNYFSKSELDNWLNSGKVLTGSEIEKQTDAFLSGVKKRLNK